MKMSVEKCVSVVLLALCFVAAIHASAVAKRSLPREYFTNELTEKMPDSEYTSRLILRLIDTAIDDARERGLQDQELQGLMRKRGAIRKCFFHAVNCW